MDEGSAFQHELRAMLRRAPWYAISLAVHILALLVLDLAVFSRHRAVAAPKMEVALRTLEPAEKPLEYEPHFDEVRPEEVVLDDEPDQDTPDLEPVEAHPVPPRKPDLTAHITGLGKSGTPLHGDPEEAQKEAAGAATRGLGDSLRKVHSIPRDRILVREGELDNIQAILEIHRVPHTVVKSLRNLRLRPDQILFINCGTRPLGLKPEILRDFVRAGGWVMSSDWALDYFLLPSFPELARIRPAKQHKDAVVPIGFPAAGHPLLAGVAPEGGAAGWWLEPESSFFVVDPKKVEILVESAEMEERFGTRTVAFTTRVGKGRIAHVIGHFYQQQGNLEGVSGMQRMILNFILAKLEAQ